MKITTERIDKLVSQSKVEVVKMGEKTTVLLLTLPNGFEIVASAACVDPTEYNHEVGKTIALKRAIDKVWGLEGYLLQNEGYLLQND